MRTLIILFLFTSLSYASDNAVSYMVSNSDINRIICPSPIQEVYSSEEKGLQLKISGNNVYAKFPMIIEEFNGFSHKIVAVEPVGLFIDCGTIYNLLLYPTDTPPQTIALKPDYYDEDTKAKPFEDVLSEIIRIMAQNKFPADSTPISHKEAVIVPRNTHSISVILRSTHTIYGIKAYELYIFSPVHTSILDAELLALPWFETPLAISVMDSNFSGWTRAFILERGE